MNRTALLLSLVLAAPTFAQSTSLGDRYGSPHTAASREAAPVVGNPTIEGSSLIAVQPPKPSEYRVDDYLTIIVREQRDYEADSTVNAKRQADIKTEIEAFIDFIDGGLGPAKFARGKPNIDFSSKFDQRNNAESDRQESLTTRITAQIIDVKPNGNLIFEAKKTIRHDDEISTMTLTGGCRKDDVTPDNTVLSTQIADLSISVRNSGNIRNATRQGWAGTIFDWIRPL